MSGDLVFFSIFFYMILIGSVSAQPAIGFITTYDSDDSPMTDLESVSGIFEKILYITIKNIGNGVR